MFWILLIALYIVTIPINLFLMKNYWLRSFPPVKYQHLGEEIPGHVILTLKKKQSCILVLFSRYWHRFPPFMGMSGIIT